MSLICVIPTEEVRLLSADNAIAETNATPMRREGFHCRCFDDEAVLYDLAHHVVHYLNRTAYFIWSRCDGQRSVEAIADNVSEAFETGSRKRQTGEVLRDVRQTLADLTDNGLIDFPCRLDL